MLSESKPSEQYQNQAFGWVNRCVGVRWTPTGWTMGRASADRVASTPGDPIARCANPQTFRI